MKTAGQNGCRTKSWCISRFKSRFKQKRKKVKRCIYKNHSVILRGLLFHSVAVWCLCLHWCLIVTWFEVQALNIQFGCMRLGMIRLKMIASLYGALCLGFLVFAVIHCNPVDQIQLSLRCLDMWRHKHKHTFNTSCLLKSIRVQYEGNSVNMLKT